MTSIPLLVETIQCKQFRCIYLKNKTFFLQFFAAFFKSALTFEHFQKKMSLIASVFLKLLTSKHVVGKTSKISRLRGPFDTQYRNRAKTLIQS